MDRTETFIKMADCPEIQEGKLAFSQNDIWFTEDVSMPFNYKIPTHTTSFASYPKLKGDIWLPQQDQLQEMVEDKYDTYPYLVHLFNNFVTDTWVVSTDETIATTTMVCPYTSMEQLWLAFVMEEKYNKVWTGEEWRV